LPGPEGVGKAWRERWRWGVEFACRVDREKAPSTIPVQPAARAGWCRRPCDLCGRSRSLPTACAGRRLGGELNLLGVGFCVVASATRIRVVPSFRTSVSYSRAKSSDVRNESLHFVRLSPHGHIAKARRNVLRGIDGRKNKRYAQALQFMRNHVGAFAAKIYIDNGYVESIVSYLFKRPAQFADRPDDFRTCGTQRVIQIGCYIVFVLKDEDATTCQG
jgi:hypothetical protein